MWLGCPVEHWGGRRGRHLRGTQPISGSRMCFGRQDPRIPPADVAKDWVEPRG